MRLLAKVKLNDKENEKNLIRTFFEEFNPESSIFIKDNEAEIKVAFEKPPIRILEAIVLCDLIELSYEKTTDECEKAKVSETSEEQSEEEVETETSEEQSEEEVETEISEEQSEEEVETETSEEQSEGEVETEISEEQSEEEVETEISEEQSEEEVETETSEEQSEEEVETETFENHSEKEAEVVTTVNQNEELEVTSSTEPESKDNKLLEIPELSEIVKKSCSYEEFVKAILEWLDFGQKKELFAEIIKASEQIETICWKNIKNKLSSKGIAYGKNEEICFASKFKRRFKEPITPIPFLKGVVAYKTFDFGSEAPKEDVANVCTISEIPCLNEIFASVDKTKPIEVRVFSILNSMGLKKLNSDEQEMIFKIAKTAAMSGKYEIVEDLIMKKAVIYADKILYSRMLFSKFINNFLKEHNCDEKIKFIDFLEQLWKAVRVETE